MRTALYLVLVIGAIMAGSHAATAGSHGGRYKIVPYPVVENGGPGKVVILDQHTGTLWTWSEADGTSYVPGILQPGNPAAFARIIHVER
jgi:hypothetical protein